MKPDKQACLKMAKEAGVVFQFPVDDPHTCWGDISGIERLIHAAYDLGEKAAAGEMARGIAARFHLADPTGTQNDK